MSLTGVGCRKLACHGQGTHVISYRTGGFIYLHGAASQLFVQLDAEESGGCDLILGGICTLPEKQNKI